ncbi:serine-rich adhesin for platelets [Lucilia cuprina]|uniref:serine-rich adhesin for platelets n=1 Tax=Lucilia cuprina TaxID=7375 RepID=UPI001F06F48B|nr:serine-rich adhesin for platelets [Lucilia cuprina]XP_023298385.2 serine-rich adhesin for platelets [Lucilia cuprina]XP_023298386.2 serine-rich adhesin for platelets [Lucilia cuprina]XP_023298387.2 serine-rich adhesin for platelets [Lucilia cuprina]XP_046812313.1 serine-rich adhesin for platelets [Lucilia cuprina]XP_046812314.1 serine-rich adhesin for platelets [Lucilia cuprina]XP_046812315.1 serine-rich adhesin for platelets [Lucilia cuprina]
MFQQGGKFYLNASNWKRYQPLNYTNNNNKTKDRYQDIDNLNTTQTEHLKKLTCNFKHLNRLRKTKTSNSQKTGLRKASSLYSISSVKERLENEAGSNTGIDIYRFKQKMANTLSVMTNVLRNVVSKQRIRYKEKGFNLDLAYVCDNIIAMGYPADNYESMYRNPLGDVYKFLEDNHHDHYKIYNLCLERSYDITKFHGRVSVYPFEDHNPPTIELILKFCDDVDNWLKADALNVAAVHCKAGKGRTGTMICCYLLYSGQQRTAEDALACYDEKRTKDRKGVTIPSQRRYVQYFSKLMRLGLPYERRTLQFCEIRFSKANTLHSQGSVHCSISVLQDKVQQLQNFPIDFRKHNVLDMKNPPLPVAGDIKVELTKNNKKIFHFWFNTFFVTDSSAIEGEGDDVKLVYTLQKWEIDDVHKDKCYPEDFKVELVFYVDDTNVDRDHMKVSSSNRLTTNHRTTMQNAGAVRMSTQNQQQSNNYSLPQNNSSGSEMNYLCDQKSSSSTSVSSSLGVGGGTDTSNGYESIRSTAQRKIGVVPTFGNHHSNHYMAATDVVNNSEVFSASIPAQHMTLPPSYMEQHQQQQQHHHLQQQQHKNNMPQQKQNQIQQQQKNMMTLAPTTNQRHLQRQVAGGGGGGDVHAHHPNNMDASIALQPSTNVNANKSSSNSSSGNNSTHNMASNSYNHNHSNNSSKTSSVSSQSSSSAIGDNEEDWESGESQAKQLEHITLLLSTSSITNTNPTPTLPTSPLLPSSTTTSPSNQPASPSPSTTTNPNCFPNTLRNCKNLNSGITNSSNTSSSSTSSSTSVSSASKCPSNNKSKTSNSSCTNRVVGGDDDDDDNNTYKNNDDDRKIKFKKLNSNQVVKPVPNTSTDTNTNSVEFKVGDNNITSSIACEAEVHPNNRPKLMHLLMPPKNSQQQQQSPHKPIFKRKSSYKLVKGSNSNGNTLADCSDDSLASSTALAAGSGGGVAISSKLKLKIKLKKNKLKLSQKFQWFQNYFRTDPVDFCENFVQQTTSMRRNSMCSMASRTHKLSTTTPPSVTPPPPVVNAGSSCEQLDQATSVNSVSTSNASIATGDLCEDYYSSICDNQLSFSNSPCKSPRSMADMASSISAGRAGGVAISHGSSLGSSFTRSVGVSNSYLRERRETLPSCSSSHANNNRRNSNNVVIVAAKPAKIHAIGFNVKTTTNLARQDSFETNAEEEDNDLKESPDSIYYTPSSALIHTGDANEHTNTAFVFPQVPEASEKALENVEQKPKKTNVSTTTGSIITKPQAKYSLNLVIVKECTEPPLSSEITKPPSAGSNNESDGIDSDCCDIGHKKIDELRLQDDIGSVTLSEELEMGKVTATTTAASVCSNSSSSGFCTSECCTTNSSSSSCNCNPFAIDLERHVASVKQDQQHTTIREVIESSTNSDNDDGETLKNATKANDGELLNANTTEVPTTSTTDKCDH